MIVTLKMKPGDIVGYNSVESMLLMPSFSYRYSIQYGRVLIKEISYKNKIALVTYDLKDKTPLKKLSNQNPGFFHVPINHLYNCEDV